ncbi:MAG: right-handed parallel beta-helix repeat-containing protein [Propionibacteriaceae bacterium]
MSLSAATRPQARRRALSATTAALTLTAGVAVSFVVSAPTASAALPSRGSATVGTATYSVPSGAIFVDGSKGSDSASGSQGSPLKTVKAAVSKASSGKTIVIRSGTYNESVTVPGTKTLTIQNYPNEAVWLDGSTSVKSWSKSGSNWVTSGWKSEFSSSMGGTASFKARFIGSNPMAADPDQVFVNGTALKQVSSASSVVAGTFAVNDGADTITIGTDPSGKDVRASNLAQALSISSPNSTVQGIGIRRYATPYETRSALQMSNKGGAIRNVVVQDNAMIGISLSNTGKVLDHVTVERNGMMGIGGTENDSSVVSNSKANNNNTQQFKDAPVSGGIKFTRSRGIKVLNTEAKSNGGSGIWFDASCYDMTVTNNVATNNTKHQIEIEVSSKAIVANNVATGGETGILLYDAGNVKVFNNELGDSRLFGLKLAQDYRRQSNPNVPEAHDPRAPIPDPTVTWLTQNITVSNNIFGNGGKFQFYALDGETNIAVDKMNVTINGNLFNKRMDTSQPTMVAWGKGDNKTLERYESPSALAAAKNGSWKNAQVSSSMSIASMKSVAGSYSSTAVGLPSDVATAMGKSAGTKGVGVLTV